MGKTRFENMRILLICTTDNMIWQFLTPHLQDLISYGAKVDCVCGKTGFWFDDLKEMGFSMIELKMKRSPLNLTNFKAYKFLKKLHRENNYNLIYCQQPTGGMLGRFIGKKFGLPVIYTAHGFFFFKGNNPLKNLIFRSAERYMAKFTDILITMNEEDYVASKRFKAKKTYKINGIGLNTDKYHENENLNFAKFLSRESDSSSILVEEKEVLFNLNDSINDVINLEKNNFDEYEDFKKSLSISPEKKIILSVSEFIPRKNYQTMLKTISKLSKERQDFVYLMCGSGREFEKMQDLAKKLKISEFVRFLGYRKDVNKIMETSDVFFHQSFHEGLTMGIIEAMHFALPVVASCVRGNKDLIDDGYGGVLTMPEDLKAQVLALNMLLDDKKMREKMGQYNQEKSVKYSLEKVREQLKHIYRENGFID